MNTQIKAEDLRCGNLFLILHEDSETITKATWEHIRNLQQYEENPDDDRYSRGGPDYAGLPITEELLLKAWFAKEPGTTLERYIHPHGRHQVVPRENGIWVYRLPGVSLVEIQYIHQLQNIFYWLSGGKELTL